MVATSRAGATAGLLLAALASPAVALSGAPLGRFAARSRLAPAVPRAAAAFAATATAAIAPLATLAADAPQADAGIAEAAATAAAAVASAGARNAGLVELPPDSLLIGLVALITLGVGALQFSLGDVMSEIDNLPPSMGSQAKKERIKSGGFLKQPDTSRRGP